MEFLEIDGQTGWIVYLIQKGKVDVVLTNNSSLRSWGKVSTISDKHLKGSMGQDTLKNQLLQAPLSHLDKSRFRVSPFWP